MKKSAPLLLLLLLVPACGDNKKPNDPALANKFANTATKRQRVVEQFQTGDVQQLPYSANEFVVRDHAGSVWYVNTDTASSSAPQGGVSLLFTGAGVTNCVPPTAVDPEMIDLSNRVALTVTVIQAMTDAMVKLQQATNQAATNQISLEDPESVQTKPK